ncbi:2-dehydro-3-deoxy-6-phosphogalactonate aldolase [Labrys wisconsinensis]|uniref:2-dehydro-3-deoxyphosphogalactonate aldolase n=1 Tax=Labrys wisconsinensis TaxID=425677 RepID=A0ABU0J1E4_9HYPH|nr:2-dehydro-3-deoxy-6-phosphogalactonate aldolase [Labrys wisconsinensis]MDQ0468071.1 2-dehydro-3-deoxyphosphogalactonate aldolase [Labrys wisconsinensis]
MTLDEALAAMPIVAILRGLEPTEAVAIGEAVVAAGISILEVPLNSPDPFTSIAMLASALKGRALVGAGTVLTVEAADRVAEAGGALVVSPNTDPAVIRRTKANGMLSLPGFLTPSEAFAALQAGADALKLFPAEMASPAVIRALRAVLPRQTRLLVVGGVSAQTIPPYLAAGVAGFGIGSDLYKPGRDADDVGLRAAALVAAVRQAKEASL